MLKEAPSTAKSVAPEISGSELLVRIREAAARIGDSIRLSPCQLSKAVSAASGQQVFLKLENSQLTGSYKERGALNKILLLTPEQRRNGVIAASAGNHAQAVAYHSGRLGIRATIVMPSITPLVKVTATQSYGAEVVLDLRQAHTLSGRKDTRTPG